eukprot:scaffold246_cov242-Pinguiococcus_pyrenoidosus.AAC.15
MVLEREDRLARRGRARCPDEDHVRRRLGRGKRKTAALLRKRQLYALSVGAFNTFQIVFIEEE